MENEGNDSLVSWFGNDILGGGAGNDLYRGFTKQAESQQYG